MIYCNDSSISYQSAFFSINVVGDLKEIGNSQNQTKVSSQTIVLGQFFFLFNFFPPKKTPQSAIIKIQNKVGREIKQETGPRASNSKLSLLLFSFIFIHYSYIFVLIFSFL